MASLSEQQMFFWDREEFEDMKARIRAELEYRSWCKQWHLDPEEQSSAQQYEDWYLLEYGEEWK